MVVLLLLVIVVALLAGCTTAPPRTQVLTVERRRGVLWCAPSWALGAQRLR